MEALADKLHEGEPPPLPTRPRRGAIHPLFPLPEGVRETKEIDEITFDRWDHHGKKERCPDRFPASELRSLAQVVDMFGGGTYQFIAFDSRGAYSRWTPDKDKVRIGLPCKPFRPVEQESLPKATAPKSPLPAPNSTNDLMRLLVAAQERADRMFAMLLERIAGSHPPPPPAPAPPPDPMVMLTGLAMVLEKLRPPSPPSGDMIGQLSGLVGLANQLGGKSAPAAAQDATLQPLLKMMTNAMTPNPPASAAATPAPAAAPPASPRNDLVWVDLPGVGPVMMRPEQAASVLAHLAAPSAPPPASRPATSPSTTPAAEPVATANESRPFASSWDDIAARLREPAAQLALQQALERRLSASVSAVPAPSNDVTLPAAAQTSRTATTLAPSAPTSGLVTAPPNAAARVQVPSSLKPAREGEGASPSLPWRPREQTLPQAAEVPAPSTAPVPTAAASSTPTPSEVPACIVCRATGTLDQAHPNVLLCRNGHRSLLAATKAKATAEADDRGALDAIPTEHIELALRDEEGLRAMLPQRVADLRHHLAARRESAGQARRAG